MSRFIFLRNIKSIKETKQEESKQKIFGPSALNNKKAK
jgi:hypothetical protein